MDQLHLPPDLYRDLRDRSNAGISAWLFSLAELGRWGKKHLRVGTAENISSQRGVFHDVSESDRS
jgi:hypothetical protein